MPVLKKEIELDDGKKIWVRQASGMAKLKIEAKQGQVFRKCRHFGNDPGKWTEEQMEEFLSLCDEYGCGFEAQVSAWVPACVEGDFDIDTLTTEELLKVLQVIRGEDDEGAVPLD
jgi:hypothetical protein